MQTVAIIGAGHNALVAACYLARAGHAVTLYEQAPRTGGLCVNEQIWPGITTSLIANWFGMLCPEIITDLALNLEPILTDNTPLALTKNGEVISSTLNTVQGLMPEDHAALARYEADFTTISRVLRTYFLHPAPTRAGFLKDLEALGLPLPPEQMMSASLIDLSTHYTANPQARLLLQDSFQHPNHPGTGYSRAVMGIPYVHGSYPNGQPTKWCYLKGGMGRVTEELTRAATALGVTIRTGTGVTRINHANGTIHGLTLSTGETITANLYLSGTDYPTTRALLGQPPVRTNAHAYTSIPLHLKLKRLPTFTAMAKHNLPPASTINLLPSFAATASATPANVATPTFTNHIISVSLPSVVDPTRAPSGEHVMMLGIEHATQALHTEADKTAFINLVLDEVEAYAPDLRDCIEATHLITPHDLATRFGLTGQHCFHGDLTWEFAMDARLPTLGAGPTTEFPTLYLCGAAIHPGGTVSGAPGYRCAHAILAHATEAI
jgi:phytoene dehydrogenase-like protein